MEEEEAIHLEEISDDELEEDRQAKFSKYIVTITCSKTYIIVNDSI